MNCILYSEKIEQLDDLLILVKHFATLPINSIAKTSTPATQTLIKTAENYKKRAETDCSVSAFLFCKISGFVLTAEKFYFSFNSLLDMFDL